MDVGLVKSLDATERVWMYSTCKIFGCHRKSMDLVRVKSLDATGRVPMDLVLVKSLDATGSVWM